MSMKRLWWLLIIPIALVFRLLWLCVDFSQVSKYPREGVWYCEEYQIQISYEQPEYESYVTVDGEQVQCGINNEKGSYWLELKRTEEDNGFVVYKDTLFEGKLIRRDDDKFVMRDHYGRDYVFVRRE